MTAVIQLAPLAGPGLRGCLCLQKEGEWQTVGKGEGPSGRTKEVCIDFLSAQLCLSRLCAHLYKSEPKLFIFCACSPTCLAKQQRKMIQASRSLRSPARPGMPGEKCARRWQNASFRAACATTRMLQSSVNRCFIELGLLCT